MLRRGKQTGLYKKTKLDISYNPLACYHGYQDDRKAFRMIHSEILEPIMKI